MAGATLSDEELMAQVAGGDEGALEALYDRYASAALGLAVRLLSDRGAAEDVMQEAFLRVWRHAGSFRAERGSFTKWLFSITHRLAIDSLRRFSSRPEPARDEREMERLLAAPDAGANVAEDARLEIERGRVRAALTGLPPEQKQVIVLAYFQGLTRQEIAQVTGAPLGTVHTRARLGLQKLRLALEPETAEY
ncbi:MAG: RNA polymerase sigma factor [Candidatus Promineifilaceae bacterium]